MEKVENIIKTLADFPEWRENPRGPRRKYSFLAMMQKGEVYKYHLPANSNPRSVQTILQQSAHRENIRVTIQNHGKYLLIFRKNGKRKNARTK